jgi:hypothetical protein
MVNQVYPTKIRKGLENRYRNISHIAAFVVKVVGRTGDLLKKAKKNLEYSRSDGNFTTYNPFPNSYEKM